MREEEGGALIWESEGGEGWLLFKKVKEEEGAYLKLWRGGGVLIQGKVLIRAWAFIQGNTVTIKSKISNTNITSNSILSY